MGQTPSQPEIQRQTKPSNTMISQQQEKLRFMEDLDQSVLTEPEDSSGCCNMFQSGSNQLKSGEPWKKRMIDEMTNLTLDNWPQQLINFLKKQKSMETDKIFQSDVLWFDNNYANRPLDQAITRLKFIEIGKLSFIEQTPKNNTRSMSASIDEKMEKDVNASQLENDKIEQENVLGTLLDASEIFDEKVHKLSGKASWIDRSFDIKKPEYTQPIPSYLDQVPPYNILETHVRHASFLRSGSVDDANTPRRLGETYNNNTILHQVPKIPNDSDGLYQSILKYKTVTNIVEKHLNQPTNIFRQLINQFEAYYVGYYQKFAQSLGKKKKISADEIDSYSVKATLDLQQFIRILYEGLNLYYRLKLLKVGKLPDNETLFNRDNILNFLTSIIFTEKIYNIIFDLYRFQDKTIEEKFQKNVRLCQNLRPQDFTIPPLFCLNEKTIDHFKEKGFFPPSIVEESIMSKSYDEKRKLPDGDESPQRSASIASGSRKEEIIFYISPINKAQLRLQPPYQKAIEALPVIKTCRSPVHKVKTILKVIELISQSIEEFYKQNGVTNTKKLDGDHTLAICMYVVAKSGLENIKTHCKLIERFSTANILNSISGYYATTLEACVDCLCSMDLHQTGNKNDVSMSLKQRIQSFDLGSPV